jgi:cell division control protein 7
MQKLQDRLPSLGTFLGDLQHKLDQPLRGDDDLAIGNMSLALVPTGFSDCPCSVNLPPLDAEKLRNINMEVDGRSNKISESETVSLLNNRVEDSDDLQKECALPMASHDVLVGECKNGADEYLNPVCKSPGSPIDHNMKTATSIEAFDMILNQADALQYNCLNDGHHQNAPSCVQKKNPLRASAYAEVCTDKTAQILFQPSVDNKAGSIAPQMKINVQSETLPQETTRQDGMNMKHLNIVSENRDIRYLNHGEQSLNKAEVNVSKNGRDKLTVKQKEKCKKNEQPKEDKDNTAKTQKVSLSTYGDFVISNFLYASLMSCIYPSLIYKILSVGLFM